MPAIANQDDAVNKAESKDIFSSSQTSFDDKNNKESGNVVSTLATSPRKLLLKIDLRALSLVTLAYLMSFLDRSNVGEGIDVTNWVGSNTDERQAMPVS